MRWFEKNTVLFGDANTDGLDSAPPMSSGRDYTWKQRVGAAWAKTFAASGYDHNARTYQGSSKDYSDTTIFPEGVSPEDQYQEFVSKFAIKQIFNNPSVSFSGATGWGLKGAWKAFYIPKIVFATTHNFVRLTTEFPLYVAEVSFRHLLVQSKLKWREVSTYSPLSDGVSEWKHNCWKVAAGAGVFFGAIGYYTFKGARLTVRLVTAPIESAKSAWSIHPALGILSGALSVGAYVAMAVFAAPVALVVLAKMGLPIVSKAVSAVLVKVGRLFVGALPILTATASSVGMAIMGVYNKIRNSIVRRRRALHHRARSVKTKSEVREDAVSAPQRGRGESSSMSTSADPTVGEEESETRLAPAFDPVRQLQGERREEGMGSDEEEGGLDGVDSLERDRPLPDEHTSVRAAIIPGGPSLLAPPRTERKAMTLAEAMKEGDARAVAIALGADPDDPKFYETQGNGSVPYTGL